MLAYWEYFQMQDKLSCTPVVDWSIPTPYKKPPLCERLLNSNMVYSICARGDNFEGLVSAFDSFLFVSIG